MALSPYDWDEEFAAGGGGTYGQPPSAPPPQAPAGPVPVPGPGGPGGGGGGWGAGNQLRPTFNFRDVPGFNPPEWVQPTFEQAQNEPGYQFRLRAGADALEGSAAAGGVLRTGGTLKDLTQYGQNFGAQEYGNVFNRALQGYDRQYRSAYDQYAPQLAEWQLLSNAEIQAAMAQFANQSGGGRGGGGGGIPEGPLDPGPPPAPPVMWKPGTTDPDILAWLKWKQENP